MSLIPFDDDDDAVLAEIVDEDSDLEGFGAIAASYGRITDECVPLDFQQRMLIRTALAHYHDKGPRDRRTSVILDLLIHMADHEPVSQCAHCEGTGKVRDMYEIRFCHCPVGVNRRSSEG